MSLGEAVSSPLVKKMTAVVKVVSMIALLVLTSASFAADEAADFDRFFVGVSGTVMLPQGGSRLRNVGGVAVRGGCYLTADWAFEADVSWLEDSLGLGVDALGHLQGWDFYGDLFGYSRFDPFVTLGVRGWVDDGRGQVGPKAGLGAFYHLTDAWAIRADADATLGLETECEMLYTLFVGVQCSF